MWSKNIIENKSFYEEISKICKKEILIKHVWSLYNLLEGDDNKYIEMQEGKKKQKNNNNIIKKNNEFEINTSSNQNIINENIINDDSINDDIINDDSLNEEDEEDEKDEEEEESIEVYDEERENEDL